MQNIVKDYLILYLKNLFLLRIKVITFISNIVKKATAIITIKLIKKF